MTPPTMQTARRKSDFHPAPWKNRGWSAVACFPHERRWLWRICTGTKMVDYDYDLLGQLVGADYTNAAIADEDYAYDANGNRVTANGDDYTTGTNNELTSDGTYTYTYDAEGNRASKTNAAGTERELYTWDYRNRLTSVTQQTYDTTISAWVTVQIVEYTYDFNNVWIRKRLDSNGDSTFDSKTIFIPEDYQIAVQLDDADLSDQTPAVVSHRYVWTPNQQDKLIADVTPLSVLWSLTDHLGTIRDVIQRSGPSFTLAAHTVYNTFGNITSCRNAAGQAIAHPLLLAYTGKAFDLHTRLQNNLNRWYDMLTGRWASVDPISFDGGDTNLYRYVQNHIVIYRDMVGLQSTLAIIPDLQLIPRDKGIYDFYILQADEKRKEYLLQVDKKRKEYLKKFNEWYEREKRDKTWEKQIEYLRKYFPCPQKIILDSNFSILGTGMFDTVRVWTLTSVKEPDGSITRVQGYRPLDTKKWEIEWRFASSWNAPWAYHCGSSVCIRSIAEKKGGPTSQCCYDDTGNLILSGPGVGTADRNGASHFTNDMLPYNWAWYLDGNTYGEFCKKYFEVRPLITSDGK